MTRCERYKMREEKKGARDGCRRERKKSARDFVKKSYLKFKVFFVVVVV